MHTPNETARYECRFLRAKDFDAIHRAFIEGFSDYIIKFELTPGQFQNHLELNAVDLDRSVGCFDGERAVGLSLNGFGDWDGKPTIYDAGTAVIPEYRRKGVSRAMFQWMIPRFRDAGFQQFLLEVISQNKPALRLYEDLGFERTRELLLLEADSFNAADRELPQGIEIREIHRHENIHFASFWDGMPSWQNSLEAVERSIKLKRLFGAFEGNTCVGYIVFSAGLGRLAQLAVNRAYRRNGIGTSLLREMQKDAGGQKLQVINLDESMTESVVFFRNRGFVKLLGQFEMVLPF